MIQKVIILTTITSLFFISCGQTKNTNEHQNKTFTPIQKPKQIKISDLTSVLTRLQSKQLEFDFFGITSNGIDCIYFIPEGNLYAIEFEVITVSQKPWLEKLKAFAQQNNYKTVLTTYNNQPHYKSTEPAPVLRIETKSNLEQTASIGQSIMTQVFGNNEQTIYEVVP